jgi:hypothetical protein
MTTFKLREIKRELIKDKRICKMYFDQNSKEFPLPSARSRQTSP